MQQYGAKSKKSVKGFYSKRERQPHDTSWGIQNTKSNPQTRLGAKQGLGMGNTVGYMVTWTTYGTWLQGDKRGYVKDSEVIKKNEKLRQDNEQRLVKEAVRLNITEKQVVRQAIEDEAEKQNVKLDAIAVCSNHVHIVVRYSGCKIEDVVRHFKQAGIAALKKYGMTGKVWTKKYDNRFCFDEKSLQARIAYVNRHNDE